MNADLFRETDLLYVGKPDGVLVGESKASADLHNTPYTMYSREAFMAKYPQVYLRENEVAMVDHAAGIVYPE